MFLEFVGLVSIHLNLCFTIAFLHQPTCVTISYFNPKCQTVSISFQGNGRLGGENNDVSKMLIMRIMIYYHYYYCLLLLLLGAGSRVETHGSLWKKIWLLVTILMLLFSALMIAVSIYLEKA